MAYTVRDRDKVDHPIDAAPLELLKWWEGKIADKLEEDPHNQYAAQDTKKLAAIRAELSRRANGGAPGAAAAARPAGTSPDRTAIQSYQGSYTDAKAATEIMVKLQEIGHLVSPAPAVAHLPSVIALSISAVFVDSDRETHPTAGAELGLGKPAIMKLGNAAGAEWDLIERQDDRSDPNYCEVRAVGRVREYDGTWRRIEDRAKEDLRDGSPTVNELQTRAERKAERERERARKENRDPAEIREGDWRAEVRGRRMKILENAVTKAKLRALRSGLALRTSYTRAELQKPFFCVRAQLRTQVDDPETRRLLEMRVADSFLDARSSLYGGAPAHRGVAAPVTSHRAASVIETEGRDVSRRDVPPHDADGVVDDDYPRDGENDYGDGPNKY